MLSTWLMGNKSLLCLVSIFKLIIPAVFIFLCDSNLIAQVTPSSDSAWIFAYFKDPAKDGLHLAYSMDGYKWTALNNDESFLKPMAGKDKLMRDPCIIRGGDEKFHIVWTVSWNERSIGYAESSDLIHWAQQQTLPVMDWDTTTINAWAPEIFYDVKTRNYLIYWASTITGKFPATGMKKDSRYNQRMYYVVTKDFKTFTKTALLDDKGFNVIDATIQKNGEDYVMFLKNESDSPAQKNIRIATSKIPDRNYSEASEPITGNYWAEGPTILKKENKWIVYFDKYIDHTYGAVESPDLKNWKDISDSISLPKGIKHGTVFCVTRKELQTLLQHDNGNRNYTLVWADEFNTDGVPDSSNWNYEKGFVRNEEDQWYQPGNAYCKNGYLIIEAKREQKPNPNYVEGSGDWRKNRSQINYTSSCLITRNKHAWQYGRFEMRAKIDVSNGMWPAWWTLGVAKPWPSNGEIDIMEYYRGKLLANIACGTNTPNKAQWFSNRAPVDSIWASRFHVWRMDWDEEAIALYVDDSLLNKTPLDSLVNKDGSGFNPFKQPHYMLLDFAIGGQNGGDPSQTTFPKKFEVDYVRVYQKK